MYLLCLNNKWIDQFGKPLPGPGFMETVHCFMMRDCNGRIFYYLSDFNPCQGFLATEFLPLSNIDEKEILANREKKEK